MTTTTQPQALPASNGAPVPSFRQTWAISADHVLAVTGTLEPRHADAIRWLYSHANAEQLSLSQTAQLVKLDTSTLHKVMNGKYGASLDGVIAKIEAYKELWEKRATLKKLDFIPTSVSRKIWHACDWALVSQSITLITGDSQIGKTIALENYAAQNTQAARYMRMPASAGKAVMMNQVAGACMVAANSNFEKTRDRVLRSLDGANVMIVDELHQVFMSYQTGVAIQCLEVLREIHDRTGCGMVLVGTNVLTRELQRGKLSEMLKQFTRRGIVQINLPSTTPRRDVDAIAKAYGLAPATGEAEDLQTEIMRNAGLGKFIKFLQAAGRMAAKQGKTLTWEHFLSAHDIIQKLSIGGGH